MLSVEAYAVIHYVTLQSQRVTHTNIMIRVEQFLQFIQASCKSILLCRLSSFSHYSFRLHQSGFYFHHYPEFTLTKITKDLLPAKSNKRSLKLILWPVWEIWYFFPWNTFLLWFLKFTCIHSDLICATRYSPCANSCAHPTSQNIKSSEKYKEVTRLP